MIFVTVGTTKFEELVKEVDKIALTIKEKIIIQIGKGTYKPKNCEYFDFSSDLNQYIKKSNLVIAHGGAGTTFEVLNQGKKLISVENPDVNDSHQWDLISQLSKESYAIWCKNLSQLKGKILLAKKFKFNIYTQPECEIHTRIMEYLK